MDDGQELGNTLRATLEANFDAAQNGTLGDTENTPVQQSEEPSEKEDRARDEKGRFAEKSPVDTVPQSLQEKADVLVRPSTWKKEYLPIWDKMHSGQELTLEERHKLLGYAAQREKEYASGVSTYRAEAENAKHLQEAIAPFLPNLQKANINPTTWIANLGRAHEVLALGTPEQKIQMFHKLASDYGVPVAAIQQQATQGQVHPLVSQLMQQISALQGKVEGVSSWREQQEQNAIKSTIDAFAADTQKHPHFEVVKSSMAQLLESGLAKDLETAYKMAVRMDDDLYDQERQALSQANAKADAVKKAKAAAVSVKTSTPTGTSPNNGAKDRRSIIAEQFDLQGGGRV